MFEKQPDPKDFNSYDDYQVAVSLYQEYLDKQTQASAILNADNLTDKQKHAMLEQAGFTKAKIKPCERKWCKQNKDCMFISLMGYQQVFNTSIFGGMLQETDYIFQKNDNAGFDFDGDCELPWDEKSDEYELMFWFLEACNVFEQFTDPKVDFMMQEEVQDYFRSLYLFTITTLHKKPKNDDWEADIESFLQKNTVLPKDVSKWVLDGFKIVTKVTKKKKIC